MKVLIVDDLEANRKSLRAALESEGGAVIEAGNGLEALATLGKVQVDGIVSDVLMPKMDGYEFCARIRGDKRFVKIPFILCTAAQTTDDDRKIALQLGADAFLSTPVSATTLLETIRKATAGPRRTIRSSTKSSEKVLREYADRLVLKLEEQNVQLELLTAELRRLSRAVEQTADSIALTDKDGNIEYVNPAFERQTGYKKEEVLGKTPRILKSGELKESFYKRLWETILSGRPFRSTFINRRKDGELYFEDQTITPLVDNSGNIVSFVSTGRDVTEERKSEDALALAHDQLRGIFDNLDEVFFSFDAVNFRVLQVSPASKQVFGIPPSVFQRNPTAWKDAVVAEDKSIVDEFEKTLSAGVAATGVWRVLRPDGSIRWVETRIKPTRDDAENVIRFHGIVRDISDRKRSQDAIAESERRFREMLENVKLIAMTLDTEGRISFCNDFLLELTGWQREEVIRKNWFSKFLPGEGVEIRKVFLDSLVAGTIPPHFENPIMTKSGEVRTIQWNNTVLRDSAGNVIGTASIGEDITERQRAEDALRQSEEELRVLFGAMMDVVMILDWEGRYLKIAPTNPLNLYRPPDLLLGRKVHEILEKRDADLILSKIRECLSSRRTISYEYTLAHDGKVIWFDAKISPLSATTVFWIARDISERRESEKKVAEQARLLELAGNAIIVGDLESRITFWNKGAETLYGWTSDEVMGKVMLDLIYREKTEVEKIREEVLKSGSWTGELRQRTKSDSDIIVNSQWTLVRDNAGEPHSILAINSDLTAQKRLESQLLRAQRLESIGTLAGGIAHDLNNALGPILLGVQVIANHVTDSRARQLLESMEGSAKRGAGMVKQILAFARGFSGEFGILNLKHVISEAQKIIRETFPKNIDLEIQVAGDLWNIQGDATQLHQLLINLCVNARDAMANGGRLTINAENFAVDETYVQMHSGIKAGPHVLLKVVDTGTGMPKDILDKIFDSFFTTKDPGKGTGLGLSTVETIVKGHRGVIDVYSEPNRGTTFSVLLPAIPGSEGRVHVDQVELPRGNGETLLVVDDEITLREMTKQTLEMFGYNVITAADGTEAVTQFIGHKGQVAVVLTDMAMPIMDGEATIRALRRIDPKVRIIATSGQHDTISENVVKRLEITSSLTKPFTAEQLLRTVSEVLGGSKG